MKRLPAFGGTDATHPTLYAYKMTHDTGFAPNPWWGFLTLATCKPGLRRTRLPGDWIAGFTSGDLCGDRVGDERLVYLLQVSEVVPLTEYYADPRFAAKIPVLRTGDRLRALGDNIYRPLVAGAVEPEAFEQLKNPSHGPGDQERDVSGRNVLVSVRYAYFGRRAVSVPRGIRPDLPRGQAAFGVRTSDAARVRRFVEWVFERAGSDSAVIGVPHSWPEGEEIGKDACGGKARTSLPGCRAGK